MAALELTNACQPAAGMALSLTEYSGVLQDDGVLFGLPVVMDTRDDSVAVGDKILLTYQVRHTPLAQLRTLPAPLVMSRH